MICKSTSIAVRILWAVIAVSAAALPAQADNLEQPALGTWINETQGNAVGLELLTGEECNLFTERLLQPRSIRACKYETLEDGSYGIFLVGKDGLCGSEADFDFYYDHQAPLIRLNVGGTELLLHKT